MVALDIGDLQYTLFPQCTININFQVSPLLNSSRNLKHEVTRNILLIIYVHIYIVFRMTQNKVYLCTQLQGRIISLILLKMLELLCPKF